MILNFKWEQLPIIIIILGVFVRLYFQFCVPTFNVDEINLAFNIINKSYIELFSPLNNLQSAPPLFLLLEKIIIDTLPISLWISLKTLPFISSIASIFLINILSKKNPIIIRVLVLVIFCFNPYIVYNSLTLKQYTIDLTAILIVAIVLEKQKNVILFPILLCIGTFLSNIVLFAIPSTLIFLYLRKNRFRINYTLLVKHIRTNILFFVSPFPFVIYYLWYLKQPGATEITNYMHVYWSSNFPKFDSTLLKYVITQIHGLYIYQYSSYDVIGFFAFTIACIGSIYSFLEKKFVNNSLKFYIILFSIHLFLNGIGLYPFSDRLFLYLSPFLILLFIGGIQTFSFLNTKFTISIIIVSLIATYLTYLPYTENNVFQLYKKLSKHSRYIYYVSEEARRDIENYNIITNNSFNNNLKFEDGLMLFKTGDLLITRVHHKFGHHNQSSSEQSSIQEVVTKKNLALLTTVDGYNIYFKK